MALRQDEVRRQLQRIVLELGPVDHDVAALLPSDRQRQQPSGAPVMVAPCQAEELLNIGGASRPSAKPFTRPTTCRGQPSQRETTSGDARFPPSGSWPRSCNRKGRGRRALFERVFRRFFGIRVPGVLCPVEIRLAGIHLDHGDAVRHRADMLAEDCSRRIPRRSPRSGACRPPACARDRLVRGVLAGDVAAAALDALVLVDRGDGLVVDVEILPVGDVRHGPAAEIVDRAIALVDPSSCARPVIMSSTMRKP